MIAIIIYLTGVILTFITLILLQTRRYKQHVCLDDIVLFSILSFFSYIMFVIIMFIFILDVISSEWNIVIFRAKE